MIIDNSISLRCKSIGDESMIDIDYFAVSINSLDRDIASFYVKYYPINLIYPPSYVDFDFK